MCYKSVYIVCFNITHTLLYKSTENKQQIQIDNSDELLFSQKDIS